MLRKRKADKETLKMWQNRCHKLEIENKRLKGELEAIEKYKLDYENLIASVEVIKEHYRQVDENYTRLYEDYKAELDSVIQATRDI